MADLFASNEPAVSTSATATEKASQCAAENDVLSVPIKKTCLALFRTPSIIGRTRYKPDSALHLQAKRSDELVRGRVF